jgi:ribosomal protein L37AE/L43A
LNDIEKRTSRANYRPQFQKVCVRRMEWVQTAQMEAWTCSECLWTFHPVGPPVGDSIEEMKQDFERQRDNEFACHACADRPRLKNVPFGATRNDMR